MLFQFEQTIKLIIIILATSAQQKQNACNNSGREVGVVCSFKKTKRCGMFWELEK